MVISFLAALKGPPYFRLPLARPEGRAYNSFTSCNPAILPFCNLHLSFGLFGSSWNSVTTRPSENVNVTTRPRFDPSRAGA